jgi:hypothetical protein
MCKKPNKIFPLSLQQLFYAITIDERITKNQGQGLMDTSGVHIPIRKPKLDKTMVK